DEGTLEHLREVAAVGARVHPDAAAGRARDRACELEAAEPFGAGAVQDDGVRSAAAGAHDLALDGNLRQLTGELQDERVDAVVRDEQVRPEADRRDRKLALARPAEHVEQLLDILRPRERPRLAPGAERRVPRERHTLLDLHASSRTSRPAARSTSPAPTVSTRSPGRARSARNVAPSSSDGVHATVMPFRR